MLVPIPFAAWRALASIAEFLPRPPITRNQVELMQVDNVSSPQMPGLADLGISPHSIEEILLQRLSSPKQAFEERKASFSALAGHAV